jgi:ubiquinone/menaquinone biosynthesis C-methylase UbiE
MAKDLFSRQASGYAKYRPSYPQQLFDYILQFTEKRSHVWDCATGNGQAAVFLSEYFKEVEATDISQAQISNAVHRPNIHYQVCPAEKTPFQNNSFDLITIAQAYHWLDAEKFHEEATRVGRQNAVVAAWGYNLMNSADNSLNNLIRQFYFEIVGPYWDRERKHVDASYQTVDFNFEPLPEKEFSMELEWTKQAFTGYLESWSAVQHYIKQEHRSPLLLIQEELDSLWKHETKTFRFPVFMRLGRIRK